MKCPSDEKCTSCVKSVANSHNKEAIIMSKLFLQSTTREENAKNALNFLKHSIVWQTITFFCLLVLTLLLFLYSSDRNSFLHELIIYLSMIAIINPTSFICLYLNMKHLIKENNSSEYKRLVGKKWVISIIAFILTTAMWLICGYTIVKITGGV